MKDMDEIHRVKRRVEAELLKMPGVTGVDIGYKYVAGKKKNVLAIRIYVEEKKEVPVGEKIPEEIDGIPTDVIQRKFEPKQREEDSRGQGDIK